MRTPLCLNIKILLLTLFLVSVISCSKKSSDSKVEVAVARFHEQMNAGHFSEIYQQASDFFRLDNKEDEFVRKLSSVQNSFGEVKETRRMLNVGGKEKSLTNQLTVYNSKGSKGDFTEYIEWDISGDEPKLNAYDAKELSTQNEGVK